MTESRAILDTKATIQKIRRIAFQILEQNFEEPEIILAGIVGEGYVFAQMLCLELNQICAKKISIARLVFDKNSEFQPNIEVESEVDTFKNKAIVLVDDVLNTGKTLAFCLRPFLTIPLVKLQVAVLVDRNHPKYPISADYVGYGMSTTLEEHVKVILSDSEKLGVYLY